MYYTYAIGPHVREIRGIEEHRPARARRTDWSGAADLSKIEREIFPPPSEGLIVKIAGHLGEDPDRLLALAGTPSDIKDMIIQSQGQLAKKLREWASG